MICDHRFYEMQSALSATGHLTGAELEELEQHVSQCVSCRSCMVEMAAVSRELFLAQVRPGNSETPRGMEQRFIQRAVAAGIPLKPERSAAFGHRFARVAAITAVLTLIHRGSLESCFDTSCGTSIRAVSVANASTAGSVSESHPAVARCSGPSYGTSKRKTNKTETCSSRESGTYRSPY